MRQREALYIPALDGMRAISIMLVFLSHLLYYSNISLGKSIPGGFGVTIFFYISGFLITRLLLNEFAEHRTVNLTQFYVRRFLRLYPPLLVMLLLVTIYLATVQHFVPWQELFASLFYYENYYTAVFNRSTNYYGILWSLSVEEHFYLFYPLLFLFFAKKPKQLLSAVLILIFLPLLSRCITLGIMHVNVVSLSYGYCLSHNRFDSILYGCLSALLLRMPIADTYIKLTSRKWLFLTGLLCIALSLGIRDGYFRETFRYTLQGLGLMILIPPVIFSPSYKFLNRAFSNRWMILTGKWSYSIYLFHFVVTTYMYAFPKGYPLLYCLVYTSGSFLLAGASYYFVEIPFFGIRKKYGSKVVDEMPATEPEVVVTVVLRGRKEMARQ